MIDLLPYKLVTNDLAINNSTSGDIMMITKFINMLRYLCLLSLLLPFLNFKRLPRVLFVPLADGPFLIRVQPLNVTRPAKSTM